MSIFKDESFKQLISSKSLKLSNTPIYTMKFTLALATLTMTAGGISSVLAICPGFNYGVGNVQSLGNGISRCKCFVSSSFPLKFTWYNAGTVYDDGCNAVDSLTTTGNPCTSGTFGCSPPPVTFNRYTNTFSHLM